MKTYKDVYKFPLDYLEEVDWVLDAEDNFVFQFEFTDMEKNKLMLRVINGEENLSNKDLIFHHDKGYIKNHNGISCILIRGWGNLTGRLKLSEEEAANIQDTFAEFIVSRLNDRTHSPTTKNN